MILLWSHSRSSGLNWSRSPGVSWAAQKRQSSERVSYTPCSWQNNNNSNNNNKPCPISPNIHHHHQVQCRIKSWKWINMLVISIAFRDWSEIPAEACFSHGCISVASPSWGCCGSLLATLLSLPASNPAPLLHLSLELCFGCSWGRAGL